MDGRVGQVWGDMMEKLAFDYLEEELKEAGWKLVNRAKIGQDYYDCIGWENKSCQQPPDLAIEMYFPEPKESKYDLKQVSDKTAHDVEKLERIDAKRKYLVIGVPRNRTITVTEQPRQDIKAVYQEYRFGNLRKERRH